MSCGKSFRAPHLSQLTAKGMPDFLVRLEGLKHDDMISAGLRRSHYAGEVAISINQTPAQFAQLAQLLPVRMIGPIDTINLILGGPEKRRSFIDWGLFHVKHQYAEMIKRLNKIIRQKNAALKGRCSQEELKQWNKQLAHSSAEIDGLRRQYLTEWVEAYQSIMAAQGLFRDISFSYRSGWEETVEAVDLLDLFGRYALQEREVGHCLIGPQRADIDILMENGVEAKEFLSRGQQKLLAISMLLSQGELLHQSIGRHPLYLVDDFTSELDQDSQRLLLELLNTGEKQVILTALDFNYSAIRALLSSTPLVIEIAEGKVLCVKP